MKTCPYCGEAIQNELCKCKCGATICFGKAYSSKIILFIFLTYIAGNFINLWISHNINIPLEIKGWVCPILSKSGLVLGALYIIFGGKKYNK